MKNQILSKNNSAVTENQFQEFQNMVVRYVYQETNSKENIEIESLLQKDETLNQFFYEIVSLKKQMDTCQTRHKPSNQILEKILNYSKK